LSFIRLMSQMVFSSSQSSSVLCCRYNYAMSGFEAHEVQRNYCSGRVRVAFSGSWSTVRKLICFEKCFPGRPNCLSNVTCILKGKTYLMGGLLGHNYSTAQSGKRKYSISRSCHFSVVFIINLIQLLLLFSTCPDYR
jgi:hypothetical protein